MRSMKRSWRVHFISHFVWTISKCFMCIFIVIIFMGVVSVGQKKVIKSREKLPKVNENNTINQVAQFSGDENK